MNDVIKQLQPRGDQLTPEQSSAMLAAVVSAPRANRMHCRKAYLIAAASVVALALGGTAVAIGPRLMSSDPNKPPASTSESTPRVRMNGITYEARTYAEVVTAAQIGSAELSACDDMGENPRGAYFPDNPERLMFGRSARSTPRRPLECGCQAVSLYTWLST